MEDLKSKYGSIGPAVTKPQIEECLQQIEAAWQSDIDELFAVHRCLTDLFESEFNDEETRIKRIQYTLSEIERARKAQHTPCKLA